MLRRMVGMIFEMISRIIIGIIKWLLEVILGIIRWVAPRLFAVLISSSLISMIGLNFGVHQTADRLSDAWVDRAANSGIPIGYDPANRDRLRILAYIVMVFGWLVISCVFLGLISLLFLR